ncbi:MAG: hypothetical protein U0M28_05795, partial [Bacteroidales bacterium]|nr:hypothetical protein [Bacteroidales bacterium]
YHIEHVLTEMLTLFPETEWITIQGETYGAGVQKRDYHLKGHDFMAFNLITSDKGRFNTLKMRELLEDYYRIPCDTRDLNYDKFFTDGSEEVSKIEDYHSHNTRRLDVEGMKELLLKLRFIREDLGLIEKTQAKEIRSE